MDIMNNREINEEFDEPADNPHMLGVTSEENVNTRAHRGFTRNIELDKYVAEKGKIHVIIDPILNKFVGEEATKLSNSIGSYVRECFPVRCPQIKDVPKEYVTLIKNRLKDHFIFDSTDPVVNAFFKKRMGIVFKEYRAELRKHYLQFSSPEVARVNPPKRLKDNIEQWQVICDKFVDPNWLKLSEANKKSRAELPFNHKAGSKSFCQILEEEKKKAVDGQYGPIELFERTHTSRIDGKWINEVAEGAHKQMKEMKDASTPEGSEPLLDTHITQKVLGTRSGYVKGMGPGPKPTRNASSSSSATVTQMQYEHTIEIRGLKDDLEQEKLRNKKHLDTMKEEMDNRQKLIDEKYQKQQEEMEAMKKMLQQLTQTPRQ